MYIKLFKRDHFGHGFSNSPFQDAALKGNESDFWSDNSIFNFQKEHTCPKREDLRPGRHLKLGTTYVIHIVHVHGATTPQKGREETK